MDNILLTKIATNPTASSWSHAYSTLNLYIVLSLEAPETSSIQIGGEGKKLLERLQREYFAQDTKTLSTIKSAVTNTLDAIPEALAYSIVLATSSEGVLYIVVANKGSAVLKRSNKLGVIAQAEEGKTIGFSGKIEDQDIVVLQSEAFAKKIPQGALFGYLRVSNAIEAGEALMPAVHENATGAESAIIMQYQAPRAEEAVVALPQHAFEESTTPNMLESEQASDNLIQPQFESDNTSSLPENKDSRKSYIPSLPQISFNRKQLLQNKRYLIIAGIVVLILLLLFSLYSESKRKEQAREAALLEGVYNPAEKKYEEAKAIISLNKGIARENLLEAQKNLEAKKDQFSKDSDERKQIDSLLTKIATELESLDGSVAVKNKQLILEAGSKADLTDLSSITYKNGNLIASDTSGNFAFFEPNSTKHEVIKTEISKPKSISADGDTIYILADDGIHKIDKKSKKATRVVEENTDSLITLDTFLNNVYVLNKQDKSIDKYTDPSFKKTSYLATGATFDKTPISMTIDGSVFVTLDDGGILKFRKGAQEDFSIKNLPSPIGKNTSIYTDVDDSNFYILDKTSQKIITIGKDGVFQNQYELTSIGKVSTFSVDEKNKRAYVVASNSIYSFEL